MPACPVAHAWPPLLVAALAANPAHELRAARPAGGTRRRTPPPPPTPTLPRPLRARTLPTSAPRCASFAGSVPSTVEIVVAPTFVHLGMVKSTLRSPFQIAAQVRPLLACLCWGGRRHASEPPPCLAAHCARPRWAAGEVCGWRCQGITPSDTLLNLGHPAADPAAGLLGVQGRRVHGGGVGGDAARLWHPLGHPGPLGCGASAGQLLPEDAIAMGASCGTWVWCRPAPLAWARRLDRPAAALGRPMPLLALPVALLAPAAVPHAGAACLPPRAPTRPLSPALVSAPAERRSLCREDDELVGAKCEYALSQGLKVCPALCCSASRPWRCFCAACWPGTQPGP